MHPAGMLLGRLIVLLSAFGFTLANDTDVEQESNYDGRFDEVDELPQAPEDLQYAFIIFRHGIRAPIYRPFQTESQFNAMWPEGEGVLTDDGKRLMFHVGESLRTRYKTVVPEFSENVVRFTSTHSGRSTMSAYCVAATMFPSQDDVFEEEGVEDGLFPWHPIPVWQNTPYDKHKLFSENVEKSHCRKYTEMREEVRAAEQSLTPRRRRRYYEIINDCIFKTFFRFRNFADSLQDNSKAYDIFKAQMLNKKSVPAWVAKAMPVIEKMKQLRMWSFIHSKPGMIQFYTGPLLHQVLTEMMEQSGQIAMKEAEMMSEEALQKFSRLKVHLHGSHDITVCPTVWAISRDEKYLALPGDTVMVEMTSLAVVRVYLYVPLEEDKSKRFKEISLKKLCGKGECRLNEFKKSLQDLAFDEAEWKKRCNEESRSPGVFRPWPQAINNKDLDIMKEAFKLT